MYTLNELIENLQTKEPDAEKSAAQSVLDPEYVEKLASAVEFIVDRTVEEKPAAEKTEEAPPATVVDLTEILKKGLQGKIDAKKKEETDEQKLTEAVLAKLLKKRSSEAEVAAEKSESEKEEAPVDNVEDLFYSDTEEDSAEAEETQNESSESSEAPSATEVDSDTEEVAEVSTEKAASIDDMSLSDIIGDALSGDMSTSTLEEGTKTAGVRLEDGPKAKKEVTASLKKKLLAAVGREV